MLLRESETQVQTSDFASNGWFNYRTFALVELSKTVLFGRAVNVSESITCQEPARNPPEAKLSATLIEVSDAVNCDYYIESDWVFVETALSLSTASTSPMQFLPGSGRLSKHGFEIRIFRL